jgi:hypothetical protein
MQTTPPIRPSPWKGTVDFILVFWPTLLTPVILFLALHYKLPWLGAIVFIAIGLMIRFWWTCVFGLLNAIIVFSGFIGCFIVAMKIWIK